MEIRIALLRGHLSKSEGMEDPYILQYHTSWVYVALTNLKLSTTLVWS